jgi:hypothetical protein
VSTRCVVSVNCGNRASGLGGELCFGGCGCGSCCGTRVMDGFGMVCGAVSCGTLYSPATLISACAGSDSISLVD